MMQLLTYPPAFGLFAPSPFCVKAAYLLNMSGVAWEREDTPDPRKAPFGKLPVLRDQGSLIADSDRIQDYLTSKGTDFFAGLSDLDRANARAFIRMSEEHIYFHLLLDRWGNDDIWPGIRDLYFESMPAGIRHIVAATVRKNLLKGLHYQGLGRLSEAQRLERIEPDLQAIRTRVSHFPFLFGDAPCAADASVAPMLAAAVVSPGETKLKNRISNDKQLNDYAARVDAACG
jgi:glutathione S-transferase